MLWRLKLFCDGRWNGFNCVFNNTMTHTSPDCMHVLLSVQWLWMVLYICSTLLNQDLLLTKGENSPMNLSSRDVVFSYTHIQHVILQTIRNLGWFFPIVKIGLSCFSKATLHFIRLSNVRIFMHSNARDGSRKKTFEAK